MNDIPTLVKFYMGFVEDGVGKDGLPLYRDQLMIIKSRGPLLRLDLVATDDDIRDFPVPYEVFLKEDAGRKADIEGYPLVMWPACSSAQFQMLAARDVVTVEQLAKLAGRKTDDGMPPDIRELAERAVKMISMQKDVGKFEQIIRDKDGQIEVLKESLDEAKKTIASLQTKVDMLAIKGAA